MTLNTAVVMLHHANLIAKQSCMLLHPGSPCKYIFLLLYSTAIKYNTLYYEFSDIGNITCFGISHANIQCCAALRRWVRSLIDFDAKSPMFNFR